jgi:hypothetical protein
MLSNFLIAGGTLAVFVFLASLAPRRESAGTNEMMRRVLSDGSEPCLPRSPVEVDR